MAMRSDTGTVTVGPAPAAGDGVLGGPDLAGRVVRGGALRLAGFGVVNLLGVVSSVVLLRYLGVADFGRYGTVIALVGIASGLADAGLNLTGSRELALLEPGPERRRLLGALLGVRVLLLVAAVLAALVFAVAAGYDSAIVAGTALAGAGAVLIGVQSTVTLPLVVGLRNGLLSLSEVLKQVLLVAGVVALAAMGASLASFFAVQILVGAGALLAVPFLVGRAELAWPSVSRADLRRLALTALPVALAAIITTFYVRMLTIMVSLLSSDYQTGLFVTSARIVEMVGGLAMLVTGVILPVATVAARDDRPRLRYVLAHTTKLALLAGGLLALVLDFAAAAPVLRLQAPVVLTMFVVYAWVAFLIADGRRRALVRCMLIGTLTLVVAGIVLISRFDAQGGALAALAADVVLMAVTWRAVRHVGDGSVGIGRGYLLRYAAVAAGGAAAGLAVAAVAPAVVAAVAAAAVFTGLAVALRLVPSELTALLPRR
jgi:O-antigen/teichoic acid export membrane protein